MSNCHDTTYVSDDEATGNTCPAPLAPTTSDKKPTLATNRFAILSSSTVRKGNLLKSPVARDMCKLTERMVVNMNGANSQVSSGVEGEAIDDLALAASVATVGGKKGNKKKAAAAAAATAEEEEEVVADADDGLVDVSSDDEDEDGGKGGASASASAGKGGSSSTNHGITMSDNRLMRIEQQFAGGKKAAAKFAAKNCSQKNSDLLKSKSHMELQHKFTHLLVTDFEATCDSAEPDYPHEIIEFPCIAVDLRTMKVVAEFGTFVRPVKNPILTEFCTELTTIQQKDVDGAPTIKEALVLFDAWLNKLKTSYDAEALVAYNEAVAAAASSVAVSSESGSNMGTPAGTSSSATGDQQGQHQPKVPKGPIPFTPVFATDGPWDMRKFMHECHVIRDGIEFPELFYKWIDVRRCFSDLFHKQLFKLTKMLRALGMTFVGERHRGIDDSRNIARVAIALAKRGYKYRQTASIPYFAEGSKLLEHERAANALLKEIEEEEALKKSSKKGGKGGAGKGGSAAVANKGGKKK